MRQIPTEVNDTFQSFTSPPSTSTSLVGHPARPQIEDECSAIAKGWRIKLKRLNPIQRKIIEKAINDVFFEVEIENLHNPMRSVQLYYWIKTIRLCQIIIIIIIIHQHH
jgi:hypothetical protein